MTKARSASLWILRLRSDRLNVALQLLSVLTLTGHLHLGQRPRIVLAFLRWAPLAISPSVDPRGNPLLRENEEMSQTYVGKVDSGV